MNYNVKSVLIICAVAVGSLFIAELVIPEKDAASRDGAPAKRGQRAEQAAVPAKGDIPVVVAGGTPAEAPIIPSQTMASAVEAKIVPPITKAAPVPEAKAIPTATKAAPETKVAAPETKTAAQPAKPDTAQRVRAARTTSGVSAENLAICAAIQDRTPVGISNRFTKDTPQVYFFTLITGARDTAAVVHRWYHNGKLIQTSPLSIRSAHWRTHSKRNLVSPNAPDPVGDWRVDVVDGKTGQLMGSAAFTVVD